MNKCIICLFFKNMWIDIKREFSKPFDWKLPLMYVLLFFLIQTIAMVSIVYWQTIRLFLMYFCSGIALLVPIILIVKTIYDIFNWMKNIYNKSKKECK